MKGGFPMKSKLLYRKRNPIAKKEEKKAELTSAEIYNLKIATTAFITNSCVRAITTQTNTLAATIAQGIIMEGMITVGRENTPRNQRTFAKPNTRRICRNFR